MFSLLAMIFFHPVFADIRYSIDSYFYLQKNQVADTLLNSSNQILKLSNQELGLDIRGELKWRSDLNQLIVRPRAEAYSKTSSFGMPEQNDQESKSKLDLTDAFYETYLTSELSITGGLQVYQWGPAEFINSSNPLYHFNSRQKSLIYKEKGQVLLRANYSFDKENSLIFIIQPVSNNEPEWIAENQFNIKGLVKYEKLWSGSGNNIGIVAGVEDKSNLFIGEYAAYYPIEGLSIYGDFKHAQKHINFVPESSGLSYDLVPYEQSLSEEQSPTLAAVGLRWEGDFDVRAEYIFNGMGFDKNQMSNVLLATADITNPNYLQNLKRFQKIGLELLGQNYAYLSYRVSEPFKFHEFNFYVRHIHSFQDESGQTQIEFDKSFLDSFLFFANFSFANGDLDTEFRLTNDWQALAGIKWGI
jgi:hypothetical protein